MNSHAALDAPVLDAVADRDAAPVEAAGERRDRQRPRVLPLHVPATRCRGCTGARDAARGRFGIEAPRVPPFLRMGSWIGGDRDGNPFVDARDACATRSARRAASRSSTTSTKCIALGAELSLSTRLDRADAGAARAGRARRAMPNPHRQDEPYRQALIGVYARLAATARALDRPASRARAPHVDAPPYATPPSSSPTCDMIDASLATHGAAPLAARRLDAVAARRRRVRLPPRGARPAPELRRARGASSASCSQRAGVAPTTRRSTSRQRVALLVRELAQPAAARIRRIVEYSERDALGARDPARRRRRSSAATAPRRCRTT